MKNNDLLLLALSGVVVYCLVCKNKKREDEFPKLECHEKPKNDKTCFDKHKHCVYTRYYGCNN